MANDKLDMILEELRDHRKESAERHEKMDARLRIVENWQHEIKGKATMFGTVVAFLGGIAGWVTTNIIKH